MKKKHTKPDKGASILIFVLGLDWSPYIEAMSSKQVSKSGNLLEDLARQVRERWRTIDSERANP
jgi:hypothetical protein